jgi:DNA-binding beta-propeller fold protein YncE
LGVRGTSGEDEKHFNMPTDMAITPSGEIFVTDGYGNRRVVHFDKDGKYLNSWGSSGSAAGQFVVPHAIVLGDDEKLYVADRNSGRVQIFDQQGKLLDVWSQLIMPWGLSIKGDDLWVCGSSPHWWMRKGQYPEFKDQVLMRFGTDGRVRQVWTLPLGDIGPDKNHPDVSRLKPGHVVGVHCIDTDSHGALYVGDIYGEHALKLIPISKRPADDVPDSSKAAPK